VQCAGRRHVSQLADGRGDAVPCRLAVVIVLRGQFIGARGAFLDGLVAISPEHQAGGSPDVDFGHHKEQLIASQRAIEAKDTIRWCPIRSGETEGDQPMSEKSQDGQRRRVVSRAVRYRLARFARQGFCGLL
jgi:hypothetical protein